MAFRGVPMRKAAVAAALVLSIGFNLALLGYWRLRADERTALLATLARQQHRSGPVVILGDSIVAGVGAAGDRAVNLAVPGATIDWIAANQIGLIASLRPSRILLAAGVNDLRAGAVAEDTANRLLSLAENLETAAPGAEVIVLAILPPARTGELAGSAEIEEVVQTNSLLLAGAAARGLAAIDHSALFGGAAGLQDRLTYDGLHLNAAGAALLEDVLFDGLTGRAIEERN